jgi:hypothetical protein
MALTSQDKEVIKRAVPKSSNKIIDAAIVRLYVSYPDPQQWKWTGLTGAVVLVDDLIGHTFFFKLVDVIGNQGIIWDQELWVDFQYSQDRLFFHSFEIEDYSIGFLFDDKSDAQHFFKRVQNRNKHASKLTVQNNNAVEARKRPDAISTKGYRGEIDTTANEQRIRRSKGILYYDNEPPPEWRSFYKELENMGISEDMIAENREFIKDYINKQGGPLVGLEPPIPRRFQHLTMNTAPVAKASSAGRSRSATVSSMSSDSRKKKAPPPPPPPAAAASPSPAPPTTSIPAPPSYHSEYSESPTMSDGTPPASSTPVSTSTSEPRRVHNIPPPMTFPTHNVPPPAMTAQQPALAPGQSLGRPGLPSRLVPPPPPGPGGRPLPTPPPRSFSGGAPPPPPARGNVPPPPPSRGNAPPPPPARGVGNVPAPPPPRRGNVPPPPPSRTPVHPSPPQLPPAQERPLPSYPQQQQQYQPQYQMPPPQQQQQPQYQMPPPPGQNAMHNPAPPMPPQMVGGPPPPAPPMPPQMVGGPPPPAPPMPPQTVGGPPPPAPPMPPQMVGGPPPPPPPTGMPTFEPPTQSRPEVTGDAGRDALLASIRGAGIGGLKKVDKSQLDKPSVLLQEARGEPVSAPPAQSPGGAAPGQPASLADALAAALSSRKAKVANSDDESDGDW